MNRSQLVKAISASTSSSRAIVEDVVDELFTRIIAEVRSGQKVTLTGFGAFTPSARAPRVGRNPRTGAVVPIPASKGVRFATGSAFKQALNTNEEEAGMAVKKAAAKKAVRKAPAKKTVAKKTTAKKAVKKAPARKTAAKKTTATKAVKKAPVRKAPAKKTTAKRVVKKAPAKKTTAKKVVRKAPARKVAKRTVKKR